MGNDMVKMVHSRMRIDAAFGRRMEEELNKVFPAKMEVDDKYIQIPVKRAFTGGHRADSVDLLEGDIVRKRYNVTHEAGKRFFWHEVGMLYKLRDCPYVPKLIHFDRERGLIYESYCGESVPNSEEIQDRLQRQLDEIKHRWGVSYEGKIKTRRWPPHGKQDDIGPLHNITSLNNNLYFIDFGGENWVYTPPLTQPKPLSIPNKSHPSRKRPPPPSPAQSATTTTTGKQPSRFRATKTNRQVTVSSVNDKPKFASFKRKTAQTQPSVTLSAALARMTAHATNNTTTESEKPINNTPSDKLESKSADSVRVESQPIIEEPKHIKPSETVQMVVVAEQTPKVAVVAQTPEVAVVAQRRIVARRMIK